jgi:hypothetical protein
MSESPLNRLDNDPPVLRALLLAAGDDRDVSAQITRAYYGVMEGAHSSPSVMHAILLSAVYNATIVRSSAATNGSNGSQPAERKAVQAGELGKLQKRVEEQTEEIRELRKAVQYIKSPETRPENILRKWAIILGTGATIAIIFFLGGRYVDARQEAIDARHADAQLFDALRRLPSASNVTTFVRSKGGDLTIGQIKLADGRDSAGIIISPGTLKLGPPSMSQEGGNALVPIQDAR